MKWRGDEMREYHQEVVREERRVEERNGEKGKKEGEEKSGGRAGVAEP